MFNTQVPKFEKCSPNFLCSRMEKVCGIIYQGVFQQDCGLASAFTLLLAQSSDFKILFKNRFYYILSRLFKDVFTLCLNFQVGLFYNNFTFQFLSIYFSLRTIKNAGFQQPVQVSKSVQQFHVTQFLGDLSEILCSQKHSGLLAAIETKCLRKCVRNKCVSLEGFL